MPLVDVTYDDGTDVGALRRLREVLPDAVAEAVGCPEEPWTGPPDLGDIEIRFHVKHPLDFGDLNVVIEVRTKRFQSRVNDAQRRVELLKDRLSNVPLGQLGIWLTLLDGAWTQATTEVHPG